MNGIKEVIETKCVKYVWLAEKVKKSFSQINADVLCLQSPSIKFGYAI